VNAREAGSSGGGCGAVHLLLSAGRGPQECAWAVARLLDRLETEAIRRKLVVHRVETVPGDRRGTYRSVLLRVSGDGTAAFVRSWSGTLCWQAPSPYRTGAGRKNWYVVARRCEVEAARERFSESDVTVVPCRTGGPGGQHRNKVSTAVRATHRPTGHVVVVDTERRFDRNRRLALDLLRQRVEQDGAAANRALATERWRIHDDLVRGDPTRIERPDVAASPR